jgi:hypothetical protein
MGHAMNSRFHTVEENYFNRLQLHHHANKTTAGRPRLAGFRRLLADLWREFAATMELMHRSGARWPPLT